jgi:hypothetical protein
MLCVVAWPEGHEKGVVAVEKNANPVFGTW